MKRLVLFAVVFLYGCSNDLQDLMPLSMGNSWDYLVRLDGDEATETISVVSEAPVGSVQGFLLESVMGDSRLAWDGDTLVAAELPDSVYSPPIPLLASESQSWSGVVSTATGSATGTATLTLSKENLSIAGRQYSTVKTVLTLLAGGETIQLTTWFFPQMGILRQEQRRGPGLVRDRYVEFVKGPY